MHQVRCKKKIFELPKNGSKVQKGTKRYKKVQKSTKSVPFGVENLPFSAPVFVVEYICSREKNKKQEVKSMKNAGYAGRVTNKGAQYVEAPFAQKRGKSPKIIKGGDLRAYDKTGKKK